MPTKVVSAETMEVGKKGDGKHWTQAEIDARQAAADAAKRKTKVRLTAPKWLTKEALAVWKQTLKQVRGLDILDNIDGTLLAVYCDTVIKYQEMSKPKVEADGTVKVLTNDGVKALQAYARILAQLTDKLGFSPAARARLVKKRADAILDDFGSKFD
jgi:P27 family predicted phage terminase small subunit